MPDALRDAMWVALAAGGGCLVAAPLACLPGLHVYNVLGIITVSLLGAIDRGLTVPTTLLGPFTMGMVVSYAVLNTVPSVLLAAPDESAFLTVLPGQKRLATGLAYEAIMMTVLGAMAGAALLVAFGVWAFPRLVPRVSHVLKPHLHWMVWCVIAFLLMSEWPKGGTTGQGGWRKFFDGWTSTGAGVLTFLLSGLLGFVLMYRSPIVGTVRLHHLVPAFVGLFTVPGLLLNLMSRVRVPPQSFTCPTPLPWQTIAGGTLAGLLGGGFAAFVPAVTGGVGALLAGHATAMRDDRSFLVSQGASKVVYYGGALLLAAVPGWTGTRGAAASFLRGLVVFEGVRDYAMMLAALALGASVAASLAAPLARATLRLMGRQSYAALSAKALLLLGLLVVGLTGWRGLVVTAVAASIGLIPLLFGARRMNTLGVVLLPVACGMSGRGEAVARGLGLL